MAAFQAGSQRKDLAEQFSVNPSTVDRILRQSGLKEPPRWLSTEQSAQAMKLYTEGQSCEQIGQGFGFSAKTIWNSLKHAGVQMRDTHGRER